MFKNNIHEGEFPVLDPLLEEEYLDLPLEVLHFDSNQPRKDLGNIQELALSIKTQGLQQPITANRWKIINGVTHYIVFKGARRLKSHVELANTLHLSAFKTIRTIVAKEAYDGTLSLERKLSQWAENSGHKDQSKKETLEFLKELLKDEEEKRAVKGLKGRGAINLAVKRLCDASGKSESWGNLYSVLCKLTAPLVELLDREGEDRLNLAEALQLSRLPEEIQLVEYEKSKEFQTSLARAKYIQEQVRALHTSKDKKNAGHPVNDRKRFLSISAKIRKFLHILNGRKNEDAYKTFVKKTFSEMGNTELSELIALLRENEKHLSVLLQHAEGIWNENNPYPTEVQKSDIKIQVDLAPIPVTVPARKIPTISVLDYKVKQEVQPPVKQSAKGYESRIIKGHQY